MKNPTRMQRVFEKMRRMRKGRISKEERLISMDLDPEHKDDVSIAAMMHNAKIDNKEEGV